jgi:hypothetical protein
LSQEDCVEISRVPSANIAAKRRSVFVYCIEFV